MMILTTQSYLRLILRVIMLSTKLLHQGKNNKRPSIILKNYFLLTRKVLSIYLVKSLDSCLTSFMSVIGSELKPKEIEIALLKDGEFVILKETEVEANMTRILDQE
eukprot:NODE_1211_length_1782_cov_0.489602.p3 type:complete len:106 gc:universal NODE_1211_length_1782_cov_0.489602:1227-910(-)